LAEEADGLLRRAALSIRCLLHCVTRRSAGSFPRFISKTCWRAFEQDVTVKPPQRILPSLLAYCTCSANPVGTGWCSKLFGHRDYFLFELSDNICTALQLANFWQDVEIDLSRDRVYLPLEDMAQYGYSLDDLAARRTDDRCAR